MPDPHPDSAPDATGGRGATPAGGGAAPAGAQVPAPAAAGAPPPVPLAEPAPAIEAAPEPLEETPEELAPPTVYASEDAQVAPSKPVTYDEQDLAQRPGTRPVEPETIQDLTRDAAEAVPTAGQSTIVPVPAEAIADLAAPALTATPAAPEPLPSAPESVPAPAPASDPVTELAPEPLPEPLPETAEKSTAPPPAAPAVSSGAVKPAAAPKRAPRPATPTPAAATAPKPGLTNTAPQNTPGPNRPFLPYRPTGYPIGGLPKPPHLLASFLCVALLGVLAYYVLHELAAPSRPPSAQQGSQPIGPLIDDPAAQPGRPQVLDALTAPDGTPLYPVPSALNETFEHPAAPADFVHYQEGAANPVLTAKGLTLARNPDLHDAVHGNQCLSVEVHFPLESGAWKNTDFTADPDNPGCPVGPAAAVLFDVYVPPGTPGIIKAAFHLKDRHGAWFQAESSQRLVAGRWNTVLADLRPSEGAVRPVGHAAVYEQLHRDRSAGYGFSFYGDEPANGVVYLDNIRVLAGPDELPAVVDGLAKAWQSAKLPADKLAAKARLQSLAAADAAQHAHSGPPLAITHLTEECNDPPARLYESREVQFDLTRSYDNPYDPDQIELWAVVRKDSSLNAPGTPPDAAAAAAPAPPLEHRDSFLIPAFFYQPTQSFNQYGADAYQITGPGRWAFRFTPTQTGGWSYALVVLDRRRLETRLALTVAELVGVGKQPGIAPDSPEARARHLLAVKIATEFTAHLRAEADHPTMAPFLERLATLSRADLGADKDRQARLADACQAALAAPELAWLKELLEKAAPAAPPPATPATPAAGAAAAATSAAAVATPAAAAAVSRFAAELLADTLLVTAYRPLCDAQPPATGSHGFVRVSRSDPRYFEFTDGAFYYPIGHNLRSPTDPRGAMILDIPETRDRGLNTYRDFFQKMRVNGENFCEVWMSSWFLDVEWTRRWQGYFGLTRMNQLHAARIDALLDLAQQYGIKLHFVLENHGKFSDWCDPEWDYSPYHEELDDGKLNPQEFFHSETARAIYRKKLRYVIARYASHPAIAGIELVSEFDLTGTSGNPNNPHGDRNASHQGAQAEWVQSMLAEIRRLDPYDHPLTNHYATGIAFIDWHHARDLFDYVVGDVYTEKNRNITFLNHAVAFALKHREAMDGKTKPFLITEYGGDWSGASPSQLAGDLKSGIWSSWMTGAGGTPLLWWFDLIDKENFYTLFRPFALFIANEDPRGQDLKARIFTQVSDLGYNKGLYAPNSAAPTGPDAERLDYILRCDWTDKNGGDCTTGFGWMLDRENLSDLPFQPHRQKEAHTFKDIKLTVQNVKPGTYAIEFWDTQTGQIIETRTATVYDTEKDGVPAKNLSITFPEFKLDTAFKIKPAPPAPATPATTGTPAASTPTPQPPPATATPSAGRQVEQAQQPQPVPNPAGPNLPRPPANDKNRK